MPGVQMQSQTAESRLMMAVIIQAIADASGNKSTTGTPGQTIHAERTARNWFTNAGPDFQAVCWMAGLHPLSVQKAALAYIGTGQTFGFGRNRKQPYYRKAA